MARIHAEQHPLAGQTVTATLAGTQERVAVDVEDWADRLWEQSWGEMNGNPTAMKYAFRAGTSGISPDEEVVYCKVEGFANLIHQSELPG